MKNKNQNVIKIISIILLLFLIAFIAIDCFNFVKLNEPSTSLISDDIGQGLAMVGTYLWPFILWSGIGIILFVLFILKLKNYYNIVYQLMFLVYFWSKIYRFRLEFFKKLYLINETYHKMQYDLATTLFVFVWIVYLYIVFSKYDKLNFKENDIYICAISAFLFSILIFTSYNLMLENIWLFCLLISFAFLLSMLLVQLLLRSWKKRYIINYIINFAFSFFYVYFVILRG